LIEVAARLHDGKIRITRCNMRKPLVLITEDNPDIIETLRHLLQADGFNVIVAQDCSTAFDYLTRHQPDVLLTDLMLPEMTGLEFIRWIRRTSEFINMPIIAMSAYDQSYLVAAIGAGANAALHKPEDLDKLVDTIYQVLAESGIRDVA
jgi:CheY-like chemotaxis protein